MQPEIRRLCTLLPRTVLLASVIKYQTKCVEVKQSGIHFVGGTISVNMNTGQGDGVGTKELRIRKKVNWMDGCKE